MDLYAENILDHYRNPCKKMEAGSWKKLDVTHQETNPACGDEITIGFNMQDGHVQNIYWDGTGCAISQAAMSMLAEQLADISLKDAENISTKEIYALLGVPISPRRVKCAILCLHTLKNAIRKFKGEPAQGWIDTVGPPT